MIPYTFEKYLLQLAKYGTVFMLTRMGTNGDAEHFILDNEEVVLKELQNDKQKLR